MKQQQETNPRQFLLELLAFFLLFEQPAAAVEESTRIRRLPLPTQQAFTSQTVVRTQRYMREKRVKHANQDFTQPN